MPPKSERRPAQRSPAQQSPQPAHAAWAQATPPPVPVEALPAEPTANSDEAQATAVVEQERAAKAAAQQRAQAEASAQASAQAQAAEQARADADAKAASLAFGGAAAPAPSPAPKQQQFVCDNKCGFRGTFAEVEAHERVCPLAGTGAGTSTAGGARQASASGWPPSQHATGGAQPTTCVHPLPTRRRDAARAVHGRGAGWCARSRRDPYRSLAMDQGVRREDRERVRRLESPVSHAKSPVV
eukprot:COSAG06_NODE_2812_length_6243_cov_16.051921_5_plen_242_part_00